jgi:hypothetical protein
MAADWTPERRKAQGDKIRKAAQARRNLRNSQLQVQRTVDTRTPVMLTRRQLIRICDDMKEKIRIGQSAVRALTFFSEELGRLDAGADCEPLLEDWEEDPAGEAADVPWLSSREARHAAKR